MIVVTISKWRRGFDNAEMRMRNMPRSRRQSNRQHPITGSLIAGHGAATGSAHGFSITSGSWKQCPMQNIDECHAMTAPGYRSEAGNLISSYHQIEVTKVISGYSVLQLGFSIM